MRPHSDLPACSPSLRCLSNSNGKVGKINFASPLLSSSLPLANLAWALHSTPLPLSPFATLLSPFSFPFPEPYFRIDWPTDRPGNVPSLPDCDCDATREDATRDFRKSCSLRGRLRAAAAARACPGRLISSSSLSPIICHGLKRDRVLGAREPT